MTFMFELFTAIVQRHGVPGVLIVAGYVALSVGAVAWFAGVLVGAAWRSTVRAFHRWQLRRELRVLRGGREPFFTLPPDLEEGRAPRPPIRSLRHRGGDDAAA